MGTEHRSYQGPWTEIEFNFDGQLQKIYIPFSEVEHDRIHRMRSLYDSFAADVMKEGGAVCILYAMVISPRGVN